ncbi:Protein ABHD1 [Taenia solium]|eukprot:TsM_000699600 transcript=TsM_000699600 gene=TsM_000699600
MQPGLIGTVTLLEKWSRSVREFDENLTVDMFGYKSVDEYYADASPATKIDRVRIPILCLNAADDPFVPFRTLPLEVVNETGSRVVLALTRHGGHIGFLAGLLPTGPSLLDRAVPQFVSAVFQHPEDFAVAAAAAASSGEEDSNVKCEEDENESTKETTATFY